MPGIVLEGGKAYLAAGVLVVEQCDLLIAIWDGQKTGGTAKVIAQAEERGRPLAKIFTNGEASEIRRRVGLSAQFLSRIKEFNAHPITPSEVDSHADAASNNFFGREPGTLFSASSARTRPNRGIRVYGRRSARVPSPVGSEPLAQTRRRDGLPASGAW